MLLILAFILVYAVSDKFAFTGRFIIRTYSPFFALISDVRSFQIGRFVLVISEVFKQI